VKPALLVAAFAIALGLALFVVPTQDDEQSSESQGAVEAIQRQVAALQAELAEERRERRILASEVDLMRQVLLEFGEEMTLGEAGGEPAVGEAASSVDGESTELAAKVAPEDSDPAPAEGEAGKPDEPVFKLDELIAAGIHEIEAERVRSVWYETELAKLELRDRAVREGWLNSKRFQHQLQRIDRSAVDELGECGYDSMLYGAGRDNRVVVRDVLEGSAASRAGIRAGDVVLRYNDNRVWAASDLKAATSRGERGEPITVDVMREGEPISLRVERGPVGVYMRQARVTPTGC
jgi:hypothetical protein